MTINEFCDSAPPTLRVLGPVEVLDAHGRAIPLSPQAARLLALLAASPSPVDKSQIAEHVTETAPDASAVRTAVSRLRTAVGSFIRRTDAGYVLDLAADDSDVGRFRDLLRTASLSEGGTRRMALRQALELWRGEPFGVFAEEHWAIGRSVELRALRSTAIEELAEELLGCGEPGAAIALLRPHLVEHVLDERPVALLMRALAMNGKLAEGLAEFQRLSRSLAEAGLVPSGDLRRLEHELLGHNDGHLALRGGQHLGRVALVFTDIVGSTRLWASSATLMSESLALHDRLLGEVFAAHDGYLFARLGDGVGVAFATCEDAVHASNAVQQALRAADWPGPRLDVRIGIAVGEPEARDQNYFGDSVNLAARLTAAAQGGQILVTSDVRDEVKFEGRDLGERYLRGVETPQRIWQIGLAEHAELQARSVVPIKLPETRHVLIGREDALETAAALMVQSRLVTLTGAGGSGKTALAVTLARKSVLAFPGGVYFVDLAPIEVDGGVAEAFARAVSKPANSGDIDRILGSLPTGKALLVVDNCEHVLQEVAAIVDQVLDRHADVAVLATSREALQVDGERTHRVASLDTSIDGAATQLFIERARAARPDADLKDKAGIADLCVRLDGMPLAIEMAAARLRSMSLDEVRSRLDDRFRLLSGGTRRARRRQQTLEAVLAWSHDLLTPAEQRFFRRLAVFNGGFYVEAAAAVNDVDVLTASDMVAALVNKSLVDVLATGGDSRYRLLESLRLFALDRLVDVDDPDDARRRHAAHYASGWSETMTTAQTHRRHLADEHNIMAAVDWARERGNSPLALAKLISLGGPIGALIERRWNDPGTAELVRQIITVAESEAIRRRPDLQVPFVAASAVGSFAAFTDDLELRDAVEHLDRLAGATTDLMKEPDFRSPSPSCALLLLHHAHHLLPSHAHECSLWAKQFEASHDYSIAAVARMITEISLTFLDPTSPEIDPARVLGTDTPEGPWANAIAANAAYLSVVAGRPEQASDLLNTVTDQIHGSMSDLNRLIGQAASALAGDRVADAMALLVDQIDDVPFGVPGRESTYLSVFAWARHLIGNATRAEHLISHTVKRLPQDYLLTCYVRSRIGDWPRDDFHRLAVQWHDDHSAKGDVVGRINAMPMLLAEEVAFWRARRISAEQIAPDRGPERF